MLRMEVCMLPGTERLNLTPDPCTRAAEGVAVMIAIADGLRYSLSSRDAAQIQQALERLADVGRTTLAELTESA